MPLQNPISQSTNALQSATTTVNVSSATAPSSGQVLTASSSTAATWVTTSAGGWTPGVIPTADANSYYRWDFTAEADGATSVTNSGVGGALTITSNAPSSNYVTYSLLGKRGAWNTSTSSTWTSAGTPTALNGITEATIWFAWYRTPQQKTNGSWLFNIYGAQCSVDYDGFGASQNLTTSAGSTTTSPLCDIWGGAGPAFFAVTLGSGTVKFYNNGTLVSSGANAGSLSNGAVFQLNGNGFGSGIFGWMFGAGIDNVCRTPAQIRAMANAFRGVS